MPGNTGGAWRVGDTVRRAGGYWTPSVHDLLTNLRAAGLDSIPGVHGYDERGREVLDFLPGTVERQLSDAQLASLATWTGRFHRASARLPVTGRWRFRGASSPTLIGHNDLAPNNVCFDGDDLAGVFDWDLAGPTTEELELGFLAWQCVPLSRRRPAREAARRLRLISSAYGEGRRRPGPAPQAVLAAADDRAVLAIAGIEAAVASGDAGMIRLVETTGEPAHLRRSLDALRRRSAGIRAALADLGQPDAAAPPITV